MSKPTKPEPLAAIDPTALAQVTGGTGSSTEALVNTLNGVLNTLKDITTNHPNGFSQQEMLMFMVTMMQRNERTQPTVTPWGYGGQGYWYF